MATKKAATTKKKSTAKAGAKTTTKVTSTKKAKATKLPVGVAYEKNPEEHRVSGKYTFFYVMFACTTLIFAGIAVWLFIFSSELMAKYESIETCARNHTTCEVRYVEYDETVEE